MSFKGSTIYRGIVMDNLDVVQEGLTEGEDVDVRDSDGATFLHAAIETRANIEIFRLLLRNQIDFTERDSNGRSIIELIWDTDYGDDALNLVTELMKVKIGNLEEAREMVLRGWQYWPMESLMTGDEDIEVFLKDVPQFLRNVDKVHRAVQRGNLSDFSSRVDDNNQLAWTRDASGLYPIHKAVVFQKREIVNYLVKQHPATANLQDCLGRTALHYGALLPDNYNIYNMLLRAQADEHIADLDGKTPKSYIEDKPMTIEDEERRILRVMAMATRNKPVFSEDSGEGNLAEDQPRNSNNALRTADAKYLAQHVGQPLTEALAEIVETEPADPIEYLAHWLYKYNATQCLQNQETRDSKELHEAEEKRKNQKEADVIRKSEEIQMIKDEYEEKMREERKVQEEEDRQRRIKEEALAVPASLASVQEVNEELKDCNERGETELHKMAAVSGVNLHGLINPGCSISARNQEYLTARDVAKQHDLNENIKQLDQYIDDLIKEDKAGELYKLVLEGYTEPISDIVLKLEIDALSPNIRAFATSFPKIQEKIETLFRMARNGDLKSLIQLIDKKQLAVVKDRFNRSLLHYAVLFEDSAMVKYLVSNYPATRKIGDNLNRTALHYAQALSEELANLLIDMGADQTISDSKFRLPSDYTLDENKIEIIKLRESVEEIRNGERLSADTVVDKEISGDTENQEERDEIEDEEAREETGNDRVTEIDELDETNIPVTEITEQTAQDG